MTDRTIPPLSKRLSAAADLVRHGARIADIGTDHAYLPIRLTLEKKISFALACDIVDGPLQSAKKNIAAFGLDGKSIMTLKTDGLHGVEEYRPEDILICGMGGELVLHILQTNPMTAKAARMLILSPHSKAYDTRAALRELRFTIFAEDLVCEDGKYYPVMAVRAADEENETAEHRIPMEGAGGWAALTEAERIELSCRYGYHPLQNRSPILADFLQKEERRLSAIKVRTSGSRRDEVAKELDLLNKALAVMRI